MTKCTCGGRIHRWSTKKAICESCGTNHWFAW